MRCRALLIALLAVGCTPDLCARNSDCAPGLVCTSLGQCAKAPLDAGDGGGDGGSAGGDSGAGLDAGGDAPVDSGGPVIEGQLP